MQFAGKRVLVTGGSRGIGKAIAQYFKAAGAEVWITARSIEPGTKGYAVDFNDSISSGKFLEVISSAPAFDILVNNAGINHISEIGDFPKSEIRALLSVNLEMVINLSQVVSNRMVEAGLPGRIISIASIWATNTKAGRSIYSATKSAVLGLTRGMAVDLAPKGISVNAVSPGFIKTELTQRTMGDSGIAEVSGLIPMKRLGEPEEIAEIVGFLASARTTYLTGQNIIVDGGFTIV